VASGAGLTTTPTANAANMREKYAESHPPPERCFRNFGCPAAGSARRAGERGLHDQIGTVGELAPAAAGDSATPGKAAVQIRRSRAELLWHEAATSEFAWREWGAEADQLHSTAGVPCDRVSLSYGNIRRRFYNGAEKRKNNPPPGGGGRAPPTAPRHFTETM
jgi:hypothetical protein